MAQPTFTNITPSVGHPGGGQIAIITGTNFRAVEPGYDTSVGDGWDATATVAVTVGGVEVEKVWVRSDTELNVRIPTAQFNPTNDIATAVRVNPDVSKITFSSLDVVITNLDDDGNPIVGESATASGVYSYEQPLIRLPEGDPPLMQVLVQFLRLLKRNIVSRVAVGTHTDYADEDATYTVLAEHPSVSVRMDVAADLEYSHYDNTTQLFDTGSNEWVEYDMQHTVMLQFSLILSSQDTEEVLHMASNLLDMQMASPWLIVPPDPDYPITIPNNRYPLEFTQLPKQLGSPNRANVCAYSAQLRVRGVPILRGDPATETIKRRMDLTLASGTVDGTLFSVSTSPAP